MIGDEKFKVGDVVEFTEECSKLWWFGPHTEYKTGTIRSVVADDRAMGISVEIAIRTNDLAFALVAEPEFGIGYVAPRHIRKLAGSYIRTSSRDEQIAADDDDRKEHTMHKFSKYENVVVTRDGRVYRGCVSELKDNVAEVRIAIPGERPSAFKEFYLSELKHDYILLPIGTKVEFLETCNGWWFGPETAFKYGVIAGYRNDAWTYDVEVIGSDRRAMALNDHVKAVGVDVGEDEDDLMDDEDEDVEGVRMVAVIGAGFGDEGKGKIVDALAGHMSSKEDVVVVRHSGGAQAGHTVVRQLPDGTRIRHVFHHFGSGTLAGAMTYLARHFIHNPFLFAKELKDLEKLEKKYPDVCSEMNLDVSADPRGLVTTPFDMLINEMIENRRGADRHGSCGAGINETVVRSEHYEYRITISDLDIAAVTDDDELRDKLKRIRSEWVPKRLEALGLSPDDDSARMEYINSDEILEAWIFEALKMVRYFLEITEPENYYVFDGSSCVIFEGSQGLLLDQDNEEFFPHLTRANVGLKNVAEFLENVEFELDRVFYVTRTYMTRHGNGPFPTENPEMSFYDETNLPNAWQGTLRFGDLDLDRISAAIAKDMQHVKDSGTEAALAVTCTDQKSIDSSELEKKSELEVMIVSSGPTPEATAFYF